MSNPQVIIPWANKQGYKHRRINGVSNYYLMRFLTSKDKTMKAIRRECKKAYRKGYEIAQKRGLLSV